MIPSDGAMIFGLNTWIRRTQAPKRAPCPRALACARGAALWPAADNFFQHLAGGALAAWQRISRHPVLLAMGCVANWFLSLLWGIGGFIGDSL